MNSHPSTAPQVHSSTGQRHCSAGCQGAARASRGAGGFSRRERVAHDRPRRSYTLVELLLVCVILGIAGSLLIPHMVGRDVMACQAAVRMIIGDLSFAQSDALSHQELRRVHFYDDGSGYCLTRITQAQLAAPFDPGTADYLIDPLLGGQYIIKIVGDKRFAGVSIESAEIDGGSRNLHYDAMGGTINTTGGAGLGGTIRVTSADDSYDITIAPFTGKLTVTRL
jgi:type II secretory pathway pseudopilin PulG